MIDTEASTLLALPSKLIVRFSRVLIVQSHYVEVMLVGCISISAHASKAHLSFLPISQGQKLPNLSYSLMDKRRDK